MKYLPLAIVPSLFALLTGCAGNNAASHLAKAPEFPTDKQAKCSVAKSQSEPLIVEWPDGARVKLEALARSGLVAVRYEGCELEVLAQCRVKPLAKEGKNPPLRDYRYTPVTRKQSTVTIKDEDDLYANLPAGAAHLEGKLRSAGQLNVQMTLVGRFESRRHVTLDDFEGDCENATHVINALNVGAFTFFAGADASASGSAGIGSFGGGANSSAKRELLTRDGDESSCTKSSNIDAEPPDGCGALLQLEVIPMTGAQAKRAVPVEPPPLANGECGEGQRRKDGICVDVSQPKPYEPPPTEPEPYVPPPRSTSLYEPKPKPKPFETKSTPPAPTSPFTVPLAIGALGGLGVFAGAGLVSTLLASKDHMAKNCNEATKTCTQEALDRRDQAIAWGWVSTGGLVIGGVSTILLYFINVQAKASASTSVGLAPLPGGGSVSAQGRF